jgi:hypothetical protein
MIRGQKHELSNEGAKAYTAPTSNRHRNNAWLCDRWNTTASMNGHLRYTERMR